MNPSPSRRSFLLGSGTLLLSARFSAALTATPPPGTKWDRPLPTPPGLMTPYKLNRLVLRGSGVHGSFDQKSVDCPFVFHHEGRFYMTYVGFDGIGYQTGLATSENLVDWTSEGCILHRDPSSPVTRYNIAMMWILRENDVTSPGNLVKVKGRYLGAWHAYPKPGYEDGPAVIGLCWSDDLLHWELDPPCLRPDDPDAGAWEQGGLYKPCLVHHDGKYYIFYNAKTKPVIKHGRTNWFEQTGVAISSDLRIWKRYAHNPLIHNGPPGSWDSHFASDPCVLRYKNEWAYFYFGLSNTDGKARDLLALSKHGMLNPEKTDTALVVPGPPGSIDDDFSHKPSILMHDGVLYHFYCAVSGKWPHDTRGISVARSRPW